MKISNYIPVLFLILITVLFAGCGGKASTTMAAAEEEAIMLPAPQKDSDVSLEETLQGRRSVREYSGEALTLGQVGQLCWAAQGITSSSGGRTAPSAGGLYPLKVYIVAGDVDGLADGVYSYDPLSHSLMKIMDGDMRQELTKAALDQAWVRQAAMNIVITGDYDVTRVRYGDRAELYTHIEVGHAAQNICLQCVALNLGTVTIGAFHEDGVRKASGLPENEKPLYILPVGRL